jgi:hypothetical protein
MKRSSDEDATMVFVIIIRLLSFNKIKAIINIWLSMIIKELKRKCHPALSSEYTI